MPTLPLPVGGSSLAGGDLPVTDEADVLAVLPSFLRPDDPAEVRDAIVAALTQILVRYQDRAAYAQAQSDILRATGAPLVEACAELGVYQQAGESYEALRARAITAPGLVTPAAILAAVNSILKPHTAVQAQYSESVQDRWYVGKGDTAWHSFVYRRGSKPRSPSYPDRLYPGDAATNFGDVRPQSEPGAARIYRDTIGRYLLLRIPDLSPLDNAAVGVFRSPNAGGWFVGKGVSPLNTSYVRSISATSTSVYQSIINTVNRIKGSSIRWALFTDTGLT